MNRKSEIVEKVKSLTTKRNLLAALSGIGLIFVINVLFGNEQSVVETNAQKNVVVLTTPIEYVGGQSLSLIGSVRAFREAKLTSEQSGRVVSVNATLGQSVQAGQILASLENASERAAVLQAEGVYDSAIAASAQSGVGLDQAKNTVRDAKNNAVTTYTAAFNTTNGILINSIDSFFANPNSSLPGLRLDGKGNTNFLNSERVKYQTLFAEWQIKASLINIDSDLRNELENAKANVGSVINIVDTFISTFSIQTGSSRYSEAELQTFGTNFTNLRSSLIALTAQIDNAISSLQAADEALRRAELSASGSQTSASDAQTKQALGALRAAQANLEKTIIRTPIGGTVNSMNVRTGDFINSFFEVAIVANNSALEIVTFISDSERDFVIEGDKVLIEGKYEGLVTEIAPAVDSTTKKTEVRIATEGEDIVNGDTVRITKDVVAGDAVSIIQVPLTAVKFERENGFVFKISDGKLLQHSIELGRILGSSVEVISGLSASEEFVVDARGLIDGEEVEVVK